MRLSDSTTSNFYLLLWLLTVASLPSALASEEGEHEDPLVNEGHDIPPAHAVLFPAFCLTLGVVVYYTLSRYLQALPYTAVMFLIGTLMGIGAALLEDDNQLSESIQLWVEIDSEVLLLVFLPGLIFKDAINLNVHLFRVALGQCLNFAFPMVLAGTALTALVAWGVFPFGWSFNLAMTFGSILSATDPVAVASLLEEVGAPPRLKVHIAGEALLNDGAAIVFFGIFASRYLYELGIPGVGENVDVASGFAIFFRKSLGGVAVGIFFGLALLFILTRLDRRFNREENVVEVTATVAIAYIGYYVAEPVWQTSGVIATLTAGVLVKFLGRAVINDAKLLDDFWTLVEHLLNTVLFTLGGAVWGAVIASGTKSREGYFTGRDWGYLFLLYVLLFAIRAFLFIVNYPITNNIGLKTNKRETLFQIYGGLRGAVGIALAIALDNSVEQATDGDPAATSETRKLFGYVGGFAFFTLVINGTTAGPLLRKMHLTDSSETRKRIVHAYEVRYRTWMIDKMVQLLSQRRFVNVDFALVKHHVPILADLTKAQLLEAVDKNKESVAPEDYRPPNLKRVIPYLKDDDEDGHFMPRVDSAEDTLTALDQDGQAHARKVKRELRTKYRKKRRSKSTMRFLMEEEEEPMSMQELRGLFVSILRSAYEVLIRDGELEDRQFLSVALEQSLEFADDAISNGEPLKDWQYVHLVDGPIVRLAKEGKKHPRLSHCVALHAHCSKKTQHNLKNNLKRLKIERCLCFMSAHRWAQRFFRREFENAESELSEYGKRVINESQIQYDLAEEELKTCNPTDVEIVSSHKFCSILLNAGVYYITKLVRAGLLKDDEAEHLVAELEHNLDEVRSCDEVHHPGEMEFGADVESGGVRTSVIAEMKTSHVDPTVTPFAY